MRAHDVGPVAARASFGDVSRAVRGPQKAPYRSPSTDKGGELTLRHRVSGYRTGDLERRYSRLDIHEDARRSRLLIPECPSAIKEDCFRCLWQLAMRAATASVQVGLSPTNREVIRSCDKLTR